MSPQHPTQKQNAPAALAERGGVEFQVKPETCCIAHPGPFLKSLAVVSTAKTGDDGHGRHHTPDDAR